MLQKMHQDDGRHLEIGDTRILPQKILGNPEKEGLFYERTTILIGFHVVAFLWRAPTPHC